MDKAHRKCNENEQGGLLPQRSKLVFDDLEAY